MVVVGEEVRSGDEGIGGVRGRRRRGRGGGWESMEVDRYCEGTGRGM